MPLLQNAPSRSPQPVIVGPLCSKCQGRTELAHRIPGLGEFSHRIFECTKCGHVQVMPQH